MEGNSYIVATLFASDDSKNAELAFQWEYNRGRYLPPVSVHMPAMRYSDRELTPSEGLIEMSEAEIRTRSHRLQIDLSKPPKAGDGVYRIGSNPDLCDIVLGLRQQGISNVHLRLYFTSDYSLVLEDDSSHGTTVSYDDKEATVRKHFSWVLNLFQDGSRQPKISVKVRQTSFTIHVEPQNELRRNKIKDFLDACSSIPSSIPRLTTLGIFEQTPMPSQTNSPREKPMYYLCDAKPIEGSFGRVEQVMDVSTRTLYARKTFKRVPGNDKAAIQAEIRVLLRLNHVSSQYPRLYRLSLTHPKPNIVKFVDGSYDEEQFLIMEYVAFGNLHEILESSYLLESVSVELANQMLSALTYLHAQQIIHRDLKPENILVAAKDPFTFKLTDFGLASAKATSTSIRGSWSYAAPEVSQGSGYDSKVDIWSLGVVILESRFGLPKPSKLHRTQAKNKTNNAWVSRILEESRRNTWSSIGSLLTTCMLLEDPDRRLNAQDCWGRAQDISSARSLDKYTSKDGGDDSDSTIKPDGKTTWIRHEQASIYKRSMPSVDEATKRSKATDKIWFLLDGNKVDSTKNQTSDNTNIIHQCLMSLDIHNDGDCRSDTTETILHALGESFEKLGVRALHVDNVEERLRIRGTKVDRLICFSYTFQTAAELQPFDMAFSSFKEHIKVLTKRPRGLRRSRRARPRGALN